MSRMPVASTALMMTAADNTLCEPSSFEAFADELAEPLLRQAMAIVRDADLAQDVVQQTLIRAWERADELPEQPEARRAWCSRTLLNFARMGLRSHKARVSREKHVASRRAQRVDAEAHDPIREVIAEEAWSLAMELEEPIREVLSMRFGMGLTLRETAEALQLPEGTVATRQRTGLERLRMRLGLKPHAAASVAGAAGLLWLGESLAHATQSVEAAQLTQAKAGVLECVASATTTTGSTATATAAATAGATTAAAATSSTLGVVATVLAVPLIGAAALMLMQAAFQGAAAPGGAPGGNQAPASNEPQEVHAPANAHDDANADGENTLIRMEDAEDENCLDSAVPVHCPRPCYEPDEKEDEQAPEMEPVPGQQPEDLADMLRLEPIRMPWLPGQQVGQPRY